MQTLRPNNLEVPLSLLERSTGSQFRRTTGWRRSADWLRAQALGEQPHDRHFGDLPLRSPPERAARSRRPAAEPPSHGSRLRRFEPAAPGEAGGDDEMTALALVRTPGHPHIPVPNASRLLQPVTGRNLQLAQAPDSAARSLGQKNAERHERRS